MQWLIDIIKELLQPMLDALKVTIHGQLGFFDRGDPAPYDFTRPNFNTNNAWHTLVLAHIIPVDCKAVLVRLRLRSPNVSAPARFRTKGNVNETNRETPTTQVANTFYATSIIVIPDSDRRIEYRIVNVPWTNIDFVVGGWWLR